MISRKRATLSSVWEVEGLPGRGSSSKDRLPLLKREYHSNVFDQLRQDSPKAACSILYISAPVFPRRKHKSMHTRCCTFSSIVKCDAHWCRHSPKGLHRANAGRYRPPVLHIHLYRVATCPTLFPFRYVLWFPGKKISPGIKWSAHVQPINFIIGPLSSFIRHSNFHTVIEFFTVFRTLISLFMDSSSILSAYYLQ